MPKMGTGLDGDPIAIAKMRCAPIEALGDARYEPLRDRILKPESYQAQIWHLAHATC
ncbi:hypothetical protein LYNGBM3L_17400 [Moorena producens 3L]|uniref:Uncharacterized protein n=1 Tax=Moorena producens 3L TaxID=489825 RepID=F4XSG6_9CYAN|nr:hypothetical protein LYNGBM3L_17400 [Moorena producens 3L]